MFFWRRRPSPGVASLIVCTDGIGLVHVLPPMTQKKGTAVAGKPSLAHCRFYPRVQGEEPGRVLARALRDSGLQRVRFVALLNRGEYLLFPTAAPDLPRAEWADNQRWKLVDRIDYPPEEAVVELFEQPDVAGADGGGNPGIYVAAARERVVRACADLFHDAGLEPETIGIQELALAHLGAALPEDLQGVALLFLGPRDGLMMVTRQKKLFIVRSIDIGLESLGSFSGSPGVGIEYSLAGGDPLAEVTLEVRRTLNHYESHFFQPPLRHLHLAPLGVPLPALSQGLADSLGMVVTAFPVERVVNLPEGLDETTLARCLPAVGAALAAVSS